MQKKVIIDTDAGADDLLAIILALLSKKIHLKTVISSYGNFPVKESIKRLQLLFNFLELKNPPQLIQGSSKPLKLTYKPSYHVHGRTSASGIRPRLGYSNSITRVGSTIPGCYYINLGPLTNLSNLAQKKYLSKVKKVIILGGAMFYPGNATKVSEANFYWDPEAVRKVLTQKLPLYIIPLNITEQIQIDRKKIKTLRYSKKLLGIFKPYIDYYVNKKRYYIDPVNMEKVKYTGGSIHDVLAVIHLIDEKIISFSQMFLSLKYLEKIQGMVVPLIQGEHNLQKDNNSVLVNVATSIDLARFWRTFDSIMRE